MFNNIAHLSATDFIKLMQIFTEEVEGLDKILLSQKV